MAPLGPDFTTENAGQLWSLASERSDRFRFEVRDGDAASADVGAIEQSTVSFPDDFAAMVPIELGFDFLIETGKANTASGFTLGGFYASDAAGASLGPAPFALGLVGDQLAASVRYSDAGGNVVTKQIYLDGASLLREQAYRIDIKAVFDAAGNGRLLLYRDGTVVADYNGPLGYAAQASVSWSEGIRRTPDATETIALSLGNMSAASGAGVYMPEVTPLLPAPTIVSANVSIVEATGKFALTASGQAAPTSIVSLYIDGTLVGRTTSSAGGAYSAVVPVGAMGAHRLVAVAATDDKQQGTASAPLAFNLGTANDPGAKDWGNFILASNGETFRTLNSRKSWSVSAPDEDTLRFEVHDRDVAYYDFITKAVSERSEVRLVDEFSNGVPLQISYRFNVEPGAKNDSAWVVLGQLHQNDVAGAKPWSPPFGISLEGERMVVDVRYTGADGNPVRVKLFTDTADIDRGHFYDIDIKAVFDPDGKGRLVVSRDGVVIADYSGKLGYQGHDGVYWQEGIYRHAGAVLPLAANYKDLSVTTGSSVVFPVAPPSVASVVLKAPGADGTSRAVLSGTAEPGTTVSVFDGATLIGSTLAAENGAFSADLAIPSAGRHPLTAVAADAAGRQSISSAPALVYRLTAADFVAGFAAMAAEPVAAIVLTDTHVLSVASQGSMAAMLKKSPGLFGKIDGGFSFLVTSKTTGKAYDTQIDSYSSKGSPTRTLRYASAQLVYDRTFAADASSVVNAALPAGARNVLAYDATGRLSEGRTYNAANVLVSKDVRSEDGTRVLHSYNGTSGAETGYTAYGANGKALSIAAFNADGSYRKITRYDAAGTAVSQTYVHDGLREEHKFVVTGEPYAREDAVYDSAGRLMAMTRSYADGKPAFEQVVRPDGTQTVTRWTVGQTHTVALYDAAGRLTQRDSYTASGLRTYAETFNADGSKERYAFDAATGRETRSSIFGADGSHVDTTYVIGKPYVEETISYGSDRRFLEKKRYYADDTLAHRESSHADGTSETYNYDAAGRETVRIFKAADGSAEHFSSFYAGASTIPDSVRHRHYGTTGLIEWTDTARADGRHDQAALVAGVALASHAGVNDVMTGFAGGSDRFVFAAGPEGVGIGNDTVRAFTAGAGQGHDVLQFDAALAADFTTIQNLMTKVGSDTLIAFDSNSSVLIKGVAPTSLAAENFVFAGDARPAA